MPFAKRVVEPQLLCRYRTPSEEEASLFEDSVSISNVASSRTSRQSSDSAKHACSIFQESESDSASTNQRVRGLQGKITQLQQCCSESDPKQEAVPVSNSDVESKSTAHFRAPCRLQRNVLHPSTRPACVEESHRQANHSSWSSTQDRQRRERRVTISALPPMPMYPSPLIEQKQDNRGKGLATFDSTRSSSPTECCRSSPWSRKAAPTDPDTDGVALGHRSKFPISNIPSTSDKQTNWSRASPSPTPEERMKCNSQVIASCIIPINVTGVGFDRDASVRCSLVHSQSLLQRRRKSRRRRTVAGFPRQVQQDFDSDGSPGSRERTVIVHNTSDIIPAVESAGHSTTRDSGCQTEDFLISGVPSRRRIRVQRGQGVSLLLSHSAGNISSSPDTADTMFSGSVGARLRSRSSPRDTSRMMMIMMDDEHNDSDDEEESTPFDSEVFLPGHRERISKEEEESTDDQAGTAAERQSGGSKYSQSPESPEPSWMERSRAQSPRKADMGSCEISSSSETFSSPVHSVSAAGVSGSQMDHKDDHQSSSGNWSGSSSTCPSQTSETIPPAASPPLTGSSHCDSELSLNAATHAAEDQTSFMSDNYQGLRIQRAGSFSSAAMDILEEVGVSTPVEGEWDYPHPEPSPSEGFSPEPGREAESSSGCPSFTSMATCESSFSDKPASEKADTISYYSVDTEGYYTSMHFDCGSKGSKSFTYNYAPTGSDCGLSDVSGQSTSGRRSLSLRKAKVKPSPPKRSSSLRKICSEGNIPEKKEPKITHRQPSSSSSKERKMQSASSGSQGHIENSSVVREPLEVWGMEGTSDPTDLGVLSSKDAHSFKDNGMVQSDYADLWLLNDLKSSDPYRSLSNSSTATGTTVIECIKSQESSESQTSQSGSRATTPSLLSVENDFKLTSPEKSAGSASPSSGYSSQSETPTSSFPSTFFPGPSSPASGKRKPKVPERKSSLSSSSSQARSCTAAATSKKDSESPMLPPSHLDLSALHSPNNKDSAYRNQLPNHHQIKDKDMLTAKPVTPTKLESFTAHSLSITPSVLQKVQLRSIHKQPEDSHENKAASRLHCPSMNISSSKSSNLKSPSPHNSHDHHVSSNDSMHDSNEGLSGEISDKGGEVFSGTSTAVGSQSQPCLNGSNVPKTSAVQEVVQRSESPVTSICSGESIPQTGASCQQQQQTDSSEAEICPCPPVLHSSPKRSNCLDKVPATDSPLETSQESSICNEGSNENDSSDVSAESASLDRKDESTDQSEDCFSKESTETDNSASSQHDESKKEDDSVFSSPTKSRTTEDSFAMIHRSKRKVLGRKDSAGSAARTRLCASSGNMSPSSSVSSPVSAASPPPAVTPPAVTPPAPHRVSGPIYRNAKKSTTSNEEFKSSLLKKGSRSDSSYRMSAAEISKSPVTPKSPGDFSTESPRQPEEPASPSQQLSLDQDQLSSPYPKANAESFSPRPFLAAAASRQGRSRIPPPASSSRYSVRSRSYSSPMQAISEGEAENSDGSPHDDHTT